MKIKCLKAYFITVRFHGREINIINPVFILFVIAAGILIWKIPYGWGAYDEPFYISTPYRFIISNDAFMADEWNMAQLSSFLLLIPVKIYSVFRPDMEGAVLFFRILYTIVHITASVIIALLLKNNGKAGLLAAVFYMLFVPFNIMNFSYDAIGLECISLIAISVFSTSEPGKIRLFLTGILFACAVLCNPYLIILFIIYGITALIAGKRNIPYLDLRSFMLITAGAALTALIFFGLLFSRTDIREILINIPCIFNDPTHGNVSFTEKLITLFHQIHTRFFPWYVIWIAMIAIEIIDIKRIEHGFYYFSGQCILFILTISKFVLNAEVNCHMLPINMLGIAVYPLLRKKKKKYLGIWLFGLIYAFLMSAASDQGIYVVSMAMTVSGMMSVMILLEYIYQNKPGRLCLAAFVMVMIFQLGTQSVSILRSSHWESTRTETLDTFFEKGPLKGARTTPDKVETYNRILEDIDAYRNGTNDRIAFMMLNTWEYLYVGRPYGSFSSWLGYTDPFIADKFISWCELHPDKIAGDIYFSKLEEEQWRREDIEKIADKLGYTITESDISYKLSRNNR